MSTADLNKIRSALMPLKGKKIYLLAKGDRNRLTRAVGILDGIYPSLFTVLVCSDGYFSRFSYTYSEIITEKVTIRPLKQ
ncbi:MAG: Veg family protein [Christensenellaceae bacterium]|nr:Veg family protein [Christensenellaceae bacterium]